MSAAGKRVRVTQVRSSIGYDRRQRLVLQGLGLRGIRQTVEVEDSAAVRGMIAKVSHLVKVED